MRFSPLIEPGLLLLSLAQGVVSIRGQSEQNVLGEIQHDALDSLTSPKAPAHSDHVVDDSIVAALEAHVDPVDALISLKPELAGELAEPRLIQVFGDAEPQWMTEGDKIYLRKQKKKFMDLTDYQKHYDENSVGSLEGSAYLPKLSHQNLVKPLFSKICTKSLNETLKHLTSFYNRMYTSPTGEESSKWLHDHIAHIIAHSPFHTYISLEYFTHSFGQTSTIARFEPKVRDADKRLTIIGAHQDSTNYLFPLLPAPGADDDGSGSISILEAFKVLAHSGFVPKDGPVEFHWYAAEEAGLLGSQAIAVSKKKQGVKIGAMMEFDMTAFIATNATETIGVIRTSADPPLTKWIEELSKEYISIPTKIYDMVPYGGSDYMSFTKLGFPAAFATEGNPTAPGRYNGEFDPYVHTAEDTMDVDDETGYFSIDHMARFSELAIAFAVEQAGWDNSWR